MFARTTPWFASATSWFASATSWFARMAACFASATVWFARATSRILRRDRSPRRRILIHRPPSAARVANGVGAPRYPDNDVHAVAVITDPRSAHRRRSDAFVVLTARRRRHLPWTTRTQRAIKHASTSPPARREARGGGARVRVICAAMLRRGVRVAMRTRTGGATAHRRRRRQRPCCPPCEIYVELRTLE